MTTRREPLFRFYLQHIVEGEPVWTPATRGGLPLLCNRDELAPDSPVDGPIEVNLAYSGSAFEVLIPEKTFSDLDGATDPGNPATMAATPSEFAARWNAWDEQKRALFVQAMHAASEKAMLCEMMHDSRKYVPTYGG